MTKDIPALKDFVRAFLRLNMESVAAQRVTSGKVHLEVWRARGTGRPVGLELDHAGLINIWLRRKDVSKTIPETVAVVQKDPNGSTWKDVQGKGANSNLSSYVEFRGWKITRLAVTSQEEATAALAPFLA